MCFIDDDNLECIARHVLEPLPQCLDAGHGDLGPRAIGPGEAALVCHLDRYDVVAPQRDLFACLLDQFLAVGQHQHRALGESRDLGKQHGLAGAGRHHDKRGAVTFLVGVANGFESRRLVGT